MKTIAYTYEADVHCIKCTHKTFGEIFSKMSQLSDYFLPDDREGNRIQALFSTEAIVSGRSVTQYLACGDCHEIIDE